MIVSIRLLRRVAIGVGVSARSWYAGFEGFGVHNGKLVIAKPRSSTGKSSGPYTTP